jgi:hypothetical protein
MSLSVCLVMQATSSPLVPQVTPEWLAQVAAACQLQLARDVAPIWGPAVGGVRVGTPQPEEMVFAIVDALPNAPGAEAYHDWENAAAVAFLALSTCQTLDDVSSGISHELCETAGDLACNRWADDAAGREWAIELCDAVQEQSYDADGVVVSDWLLPAFFSPGAPGPFSFVQLQGGTGPGAPFGTTAGGYQLQRASGSGETQVTGTLGRRAARAKHYSSRTFRRGLRAT